MLQEENGETVSSALIVGDFSTDGERMNVVTETKGTVRAVGEKSCDRVVTVVGDSKVARVEQKHLSCVTY